MTRTARVYAKEIVRFVTECIVSAGSPRKAGEQVADVLVEADKRGHRSHGLNRLERYVQDIKTGRCNPYNTPKIVKESASTAWVNANNVLGASSANFGSDLAIKKAEETGVGWVAVGGSNHYGIGGYWAQKVADRGMIGMTFTNGSPLVAPTRSLKAALGTNPLAVCAPALPDTGPFYLDIATATVAIGKRASQPRHDRPLFIGLNDFQIEMYRRLGIKLEPGWAQGPDGKETLDPELAMKEGVLMPLGGTEKSAGYKGFGLAALVDLFSGILAGSHYGHHVPKWSPDAKNVANIGQTFVAINQKCFAPGFEERVSDCINYWRKMTPADPKFPVLAPGDLEKRAAAEAESSGIIVYIIPLLESVDKLANELKVQPIQRMKAGE